MTKTGLFATSFVAALPGAALAYLMVMVFLNFSGGGTVWTKVLAGMLLLIGGLLAVMPVGIILFAGPKTEKAPKKSAEKSDDDEGELLEAEDDEAVLEAEDDAASEDFVATDTSLEVFEAGTDEFALTGEVVHGSADTSSEEFDLGEDFESAAEEADLFEMDDDEPKKKKEVTSSLGG